MADSSELIDFLKETAQQFGNDPEILAKIGQLQHLLDDRDQTVHEESRQIAAISSPEESSQQQQQLLKKIERQLEQVEQMLLDEESASAAFNMNRLAETVPDTIPISQGPAPVPSTRQILSESSALWMPVVVDLKRLSDTGLPDPGDGHAVGHKSHLLPMQE